MKSLFLNIAWLCLCGVGLGANLALGHSAWAIANGLLAIIAVLAIVFAVYRLILNRQLSQLEELRRAMAIARETPRIFNRQDTANGGSRCAHPGCPITDGAPCAYPACPNRTPSTPVPGRDA